MSDTSVVSQVAEALDDLIEAPYGVVPAGRCIALLVVREGRPRLLSTVEFAAGFANEADTAAGELGRKVEEFVDDVSIELRHPWPTGSVSPLSVHVSNGQLEVTFGTGEGAIVLPPISLGGSVRSAG